MMSTEERIFVQELAKAGDMDKARERIKDHCTFKVMAMIDDMREDDLIELLSDSYNVHEMSELDTEFRYLTPTEVLEQLSDINTGDSFFNSETCESGDDICEVAGVDKDEVAREILDGDIYWDGYELDEITELEDELLREVQKKMEEYEKVKKLFDMAMDKEPTEVMNVLWNMYQE